MSVKPAKMQFNGGELSPWLRGRTDIAKFSETAKLCRNFIPLTEGSLKRRGGTKFVALTPDAERVDFSIVAEPEEAEILINNQKQNHVFVTSGDVVNYEVRARGYETVSGKITVTSDLMLRVTLISTIETATLQITAIPSLAVVKINGYERTSYTGAKNEKVKYLVYCDGYKVQSGEIVLNEDKNLTITLESDEGESGAYGDWGDPLAFISCTACGSVDPQLKCILIRFEHGYLPILFNAAKIAPDAGDVNESLFIYDENSGYDSCVHISNIHSLAVISRGSNYISYDNRLGERVFVVDYLTMMICGWQLNGEGDYATVYRFYDGVIAGNTVKIYYQGNLIFSLKGRNNG